AGIISASQIAEACNGRSPQLCQQHRDILFQTPTTRHHGKPYAIRRVKNYIAAYCDPALALLGVANLWDHFYTVQHGEPGLKRRFLVEAKEVLMPLLEMLGISILKPLVEAWVMQNEPNRADYDYLKSRLAQNRSLHQQAFDLVQQALQPELSPAAVLKHNSPTPAQIYDPQLPEKASPDAFLTLSVDLIVAQEVECYTLLHQIHRRWPPLDGSLVDYIGAGLPSGQRYLKTAVTVPTDPPVRVEFKIRTEAMDRINQWGLAVLAKDERPLLELPRAWWSQREAGYGHICSAALGDLPETLYVFSPRGELFRFRRGCTVVDYAYQVHSEIAHQCQRFKVNGEVVNPGTVLHHLDLVELERDPQSAGPTRAWLNAARTQRARSQIERVLRRQEQNQNQGRALIDNELREQAEYYRLDVPTHRVEQALNQAARRLNFERTEDLLTAISAGRAASDSIVHAIFAAEIVRQIETPPDIRLFPRQLNLAQCCKPRPSDPIVGNPRYRGHEVIHLKIHRADCPHLEPLRTPLIPLQWRLQPQLKAVARLEITALAKDSLLHDILHVFEPYYPNLTLHKVEALTRSGTTSVSLTIEAKNHELIAETTNILRRLPGHRLNEVRQMQLLLSEREELAQPVTLTSFNPYRRQPVQEREMFFGRTKELAQVYDWLRTGTGVIYVQGQRRVGKTSLLLHLKKYYLTRYAVLPVFIDFQILQHLTGPDFYYEVASAIYNNLQNDQNPHDLEPPLHDLFEQNPATELTGYLNYVQRHFGRSKLVLLIDEFSRTIDAYRQQRLDQTFFEQWRGLIQATLPDVCYVMVVQVQTYNLLNQERGQMTVAPIWHLLELGESLPLRPLDQQAARQLIERPTYNILEYSPQAIQYIWRLSGGSPFLIHALCFNLVRHMAHKNERRVERSDVELVHADFMRPSESLFAHLLDIVHTVQAGLVCRHLARALATSDRPVPFEKLQTELTNLPVLRLRHLLEQLKMQHILVEPQPDQWQFASLLFGRWLAMNRILE
ncbi:MAG TPA: TGS domain-containing protein, partial [Anaerolineae bacterium]|nr:TGS domain-containing protein [Anaerolineae bacterium]